MSTNGDKGSFFARFSDGYAKWMPDAFLFAVILTFLTMILAFFLTASGTKTVLGGWLSGFSITMTFAFQVAWLMVTAMVLVNARVVHRGIVWLGTQVTTPNAAYAAVFIVSGIACWLNVYAGVVIASVYARTVAEEVKGTHFPMICGAAYSGFITWHNGLAGSIPLVINTPGNKFEKLVGGIISTDQTIFSTMNLSISIALVVVIGIAFYLMAPKRGEKVRTIDEYLEGGRPAGQNKVRPDSDAAGGAKSAQTTTDSDRSDKGTFSLATFLEENAVVGRIFGLIALAYILYVFCTKGFGKSLNLDNLGFTIFGLGMIAYPSAMAYMRAAGKYAGGCAGVLIQFPMFGGIMGIMMDSGLAKVITDSFVAVSTAATFPVLSFLSAGLVNIFIPSGGAQWAAQAPITMPAAHALGVSPAKAAMTIAYGDAWTNMIQPFWMLMYAPVLLAGTTLKVREMMGYCLFTLILSGIIFALGLAFL